MLLPLVIEEVESARGLDVQRPVRQKVRQKSIVVVVGGVLVDRGDGTVARGGSREVVLGMA